MDDEKIPPKPPDIEPFLYTPVCTITLPQTQHDPIEQMDTGTSRKRPAVSDPPTPKVTPTKVLKAATNSTTARKKYSNMDKSPFIVHVSRKEEERNSGTTLHHVKFGLFLLQNNINNILPDGIKRLGRNRVAVEFKSPEDANAFLSNPVLEHNKYLAYIPQFNVTRMGLVRGVPSDWTDEEVVTYIKVPYGCGKILKARRLNRRTLTDDGHTEWKPSQTVVLTFDGQTLPQKVYCCFSALEVELYKYPTVQCYNCCRFGHTRNLCRSKPRCYKCGLDHPGDGCNLNIKEATCINCCNDHPATSKDCPEYNRQTAIKQLMAEMSISYSEATKKIPPVSTRYAMATKRSTSQPRPSLLHSPTHRQQGPPRSYQQTQEAPKSYRKTVYLKPRSRSPVSPGYDRLAHQNLVRDYSYSPSHNGCALSQDQTAPRPVSDDPIEQIVNLICSLLMSKSLPDHVAHKLNTIMNALHNDSPPDITAVEREEY